VLWEDFFTLNTGSSSVMTATLLAMLRLAKQKITYGQYPLRPTGTAVEPDDRGVASSVTYDTLGRVQTATNALSAMAFAYTYLGNTGRVASVTNPNGQSSVYTYQDTTTTPNEPRLTEIKNLSAASAVISKFDYGYNAEGQITSWTQQTDSSDLQNWALQYDTEGKLINANVTDTVTSAVLHQYAYLYDAAQPHQRADRRERHGGQLQQSKSAHQP
jgi:YD repeat-containing protein